MSDLKPFLRRALKVAAWLVAGNFLFGILFWTVIYPANADYFYSKFEVRELVEKGEVFAKTADRYNLIFFGTSKVYRQVDPLVVDSVLGTGVRSYNLAYMNLFPFRLFDFINRQAPALRPGTNVVIELAPPARLKYNANAMPILNAMSFDRMKVAGRFFSDYKCITRVRWLSTLEYAYAYINRYNGILILREWLYYSEWPTEEAVRGRRGYFSLTDEADDNPLLALREKNFANSAQVTRDITAPCVRDVADDPYYHYVVAEAESLRTRGLTVYFLITPRNGRDYSWKELYKDHLAGAGYETFDFADESRYAPFYSKDFSFDDAHLNAEGARAFSVALASQLATKLTVKK